MDAPGLSTIVWFREGIHPSWGYGGGLRVQGVWSRLVIVGLGRLNRIRVGGSLQHDQLTASLGQYGDEQTVIVLDAG